MNITTYSATVKWLSPYLTFTPEQYTVNYGTERDSLNQMGPVLSSSTDISVSNITYNISLQNLTPHTEYFYQLLSTNTYGETTSAIMTFTTSEAGENIATKQLLCFV